MDRDVLTLNIPRKPNYISLVRLTSSSIANNAGLNIDDIEDIKVAVGEACINVLDLSNKDEISIKWEIDQEKMTINVENVVEDIPEELDESKERDLGLLIIKTLMDDVSFSDKGIKMIKYIKDGSQ